MGAVSAVGWHLMYGLIMHTVPLFFFHVCPKILKTVANYYGFGI